MKRWWEILVALILLIIIVLIFGRLALILISGEAAHSAGYNGPEARSARLFARDGSLSFIDRGLRSYPFGQVRQLETTLRDGSRALYEVEVESGEVCGFFRYDQVAEEIKIEREKAALIATNFARTHYSNFDEMGLVLARESLIDSGPYGDKYYSFEWRKLDKESGAILPCMVRVKVNAATGQVDSYLSLREEVEVSTLPQVSREEAGRLALEALGKKRKVVQAELAISTVPLYQPGKQALLWRITLEGEKDRLGYTPGEMVFIDAHSGKVVHIEPYL